MSGWPIIVMRSFDDDFAGFPDYDIWREFDGRRGARGRCAGSAVQAGGYDDSNQWRRRPRNRRKRAVVLKLEHGEPGERAPDDGGDLATVDVEREWCRVTHRRRAAGVELAARFHR